MTNVDEKKAKLTLSGRLTIENAQKICDELQSSFENSFNPEIFLTEIEEIDLSFLQILYSLILTAHKLEKKISVFIDDPELINKLLVAGGFESHFRIKKDQSGTNSLIEGIIDG
ncbi:MAG: STAS domain-containing protein [Proteobacteria bacterium]|nr:STAS domain-containing protein [Pseudomonadota bacterium]